MKKTIVLLIVLAGLVGFAVFYQGNRDQRINSARLVGVPDRDTLFPELEVGKIRKIRVSEGASQVNLEVEGEERWVVRERHGYGASFDKISRSVEELGALKITNKEVVGPSVLAELKLLPPKEGAAPGSTGLQVELIDEKGGVLASFVAGDSTTTTGGANSGSFMGRAEQRYVHTPADKDTVWLTGDPLSSWTAEAKDWLDRAFFTVKDIKSVEVTAANAADSWAVERADKTGAFSLKAPAEGEALDSAKAGGLSSLLSSPTFSDVLAKDKAGDLNALVSAKIVTFDGFSYEVKVLEKKDDAAPAEDRNYFLEFAVTAEFPKQRTAGTEEKEEDKKKLDEEFATNLKKLEDKLAQEKALAGWVYEVAKYPVETLLKKRAELLVEKPAALPAEATPAAGSPPAPAPPPAAETTPAAP